MNDILLPYHTAGKEEIRYALRSIEKYQPGRVVLVGDRPTWFKGDHIPCENNQPTKQTNVRNKILASIPYLTENFILWNDDIYKLNSDPLIPTNCGTLQDELKKDHTSRFHACLINTAKIYPNGLFYGNHYPITINKEKFKEAMNVNWKKDYNVKSLYGNYAEIKGEYREDCKLKFKSDIQAFIKEKQFFSTPTAITDSMIKVLNELFPGKSQYEK